MSDKKVLEDDAIKLNITVMTLMSQLIGLRLIDLRTVARSIPIDDINLIGVLMRDGMGEIVRGYTGVKTNNNTFPRCLYVYLCPDPAFPNQTVVVKVCANGKLHINGAKAVSIGDTVASILARTFTVYNIDGVEYTCPNITHAPVEVLMINGSSALGYPIHKNKLVELFEETGLRSQEEGTSPARKIIWFWNLSKQRVNGVCNCSNQCMLGRGNGMGDGQCNRCVISILSSGNLQFMGCRFETQLYYIYQKTLEFITKHKEQITQTKLSLSAKQRRRAPLTLT